MMRLVSASPESSVREIPLGPGTYALGRLPENQICIPSPGVSGRHCTLAVGEAEIAVADPGSTNGTFINGRQVAEGTLRAGDEIRFGFDAFHVHGDHPPAAPARPGLSISAPVAHEPRPSVATTSMHPSLEKRIAEQFKNQPKLGDFWSELRMSFAYPFRGSGWIKMLIATIAFGVLDFAGRFSFYVWIIGTGYLFAFIQANITHSAEGERELADWPDVSSWWDDIIKPCLLYTLVSLCAFAPLLAYMLSGLEPNPLIIFGLGALGLAYYPMAILATAMSDSFTGLNPLAVLPPIARMPLQYGAAFGFFMVIAGVGIALQFLMGLIPIPFVGALPAGFVTLYMVTVGARILGVLYGTQKEKFHWFD